MLSTASLRLVKWLNSARFYFESRTPLLPVSYLICPWSSWRSTSYSPFLWSWFSCLLASSWRRCTGPEPHRRTGHRRWRWPRLRPSPRPSCPWRARCYSTVAAPSPHSCCLLSKGAFLLVHTRGQRSSMLNENSHSVIIWWPASSVISRCLKNITQPGRKQNQNIVNTLCLFYNTI